jgi:hypothetical protein
MKRYYFGHYFDFYTGKITKVCTSSADNIPAGICNLKSVVAKNKAEAKKKIKQQ